MDGIQSVFWFFNANVNLISFDGFVRLNSVHPVTMESGRSTTTDTADCNKVVKKTS